MKVDANTPVPLILDSLRSNMGWKVIEERVAAVRDAYMLKVRMSPATTDPRELQRWMGVAEGLDRILRDPVMLEREWKAVRKQQEKRAESERLRAANAFTDE